jgi:protein-S-isoprenylcysteine O-methyltransferase Ste14
VLFASLALILLFWKWEPIGGVVWSVESPATRMALQGISLLGWLIVLVSTFLVFAIAKTGYILIAIQLEERDLVEAYGDRYEAYRGQVSMLMPRPPRKPGLQAGPSPH